MYTYIDALLESLGPVGRGKRRRATVYTHIYTRICTHIYRDMYTHIGLLLESLGPVERGKRRLESLRQFAFVINRVPLTGHNVSLHA